MLIEMDVKVETLSVNNGYLSIKIPALNLVFLDSYRYIKTGLARFSSRFPVRNQKGFFCHSFLNWDSLQYIGKFPGIDHYKSFSDSKKSLAEKEEFLAQNATKLFVMQNELAIYNALDCLILLLGVCMFNAHGFQIQKTLQKMFDFTAPKKSIGYIYPIHPETPTLGSFA